jgi:hypothetical protein
MYSGAASTVTEGNFSASSSAYPQCVVTRRSSSSPAAASTNVPVHTEASRRLRRASRRICASSPSSSTASAVPAPPTTSVVSIRPVTVASRRAPASTIPDELRAARPETVASSTVYGGAAPCEFAISSAPLGHATSRICTSSYATITTRREASASAATRAIYRAGNRSPFRADFSWSDRTGRR